MRGITAIVFALISATAWANPFPGPETDWHGFERHDFQVDGRNALVVLPKAAAAGNPWIWRAEFFDHRPEADIALVEKGFHLAFIDVGNTFGCPDAMAHWDVFYKLLTEDHGLSKKPALEGLSRGGLYVYNWAAANPGKVSCIYGDNPVCDFKSWPGGKGKGPGSPDDWKALQACYHFATETQALVYTKNPLDNIAPLAAAKIPIIHLCGDADEVVPFEENTVLMKQRYDAMAGEMRVMVKHGYKHHPHGLDDPLPIVNFILAHTDGYVPEPFKPITDKTLVAWISPANLTQHGGSVLTFEDAGDRFDGIVFAELAHAKWMAGSDTYARTQQDQKDAPEETAAPGTFLQMAIVYQGSDVTIYRDAKPYAHYTMPNPPHEFGQRSVVNIGKRHRHQGDPAFFAGEIDDARIYDSALSIDQIAALKPNAPSVPIPWAWWSFEDDNADERTGRFLDTQLAGGATVKDGHLILDGTDDTLLAKSGQSFPFTPETPARPEHPPKDWLTYHLAHPGPGAAMPGDPNCAFYWHGEYHLHYIYNNKDGFSFAHVSSPDMLHWKWHPTTLTPPNTDHGMFSGTGFFTKEGRPAIIYHGEGSGRNQIAIALDDQLEKWTKPTAIEPRIQPGQDATKIANWDPDAWVDNGHYYALSGGNPGSGKPPTIFRSDDLKNWDYLGLFMTKDMPDVQPDEDVSCPNFFHIGNKYMLLCISHNKGCRYYLGDWKDERFTPEFHARMNWKKQDGQNWGGDFFAPESLLTADGRRVMWAWCILNTASKQSGIQSLPRELSLPEDGILRINPLRELETLRYDEKLERSIEVKSGTPYPLKEISGDTIEIRIAAEPRNATKFGVEVYCDANGNNGFPITIEPAEHSLTVGDVKVPFTLPEHQKIGLDLRVFLDKDMVEVFASGVQAAVAVHQHAPESIGLRLIAEGTNVQVPLVSAWNMNPLWPEFEKK